jgi:hypothetical protein
MSDMGEFLSDILFWLTYVVEWALERAHKKSADDSGPEPPQNRTKS